MKIIEITRGEKPEGHCFKFGITLEHDYYIALPDESIDSIPDYQKESYVHSFLVKVRRLVKQPSFEYTKKFKQFNDKHLFPKLT